MIVIMIIYQRTLLTLSTAAGLMEDKRFVAHD